MQYDWMRKMKMRRYHFQRENPVVVPMDGHKYVVATDARVIVAIQDDEVSGYPVRAPEESRFGQNVVNLLREANELMTKEPTVSLSMSTIKDWLELDDEPKEPCSVCNDTREIACADCKGEGEVECECLCGHEHYTTCDNCNGQRYFPCHACSKWMDEDPARIGDVIFNRVLLRNGVRGLPDDEEVFLWLRESLTEVTWFRGKGWVLGIMCMPRESFSKSEYDALPQLLKEEADAA